MSHDLGLSDVSSSSKHLKNYLFVHLFERESPRAGRGAKGAGEAVSLLNGEPNMGLDLDPRTLRS